LKHTVQATATIAFASLTDGLKRLRLHSRDTTVLTVTDSDGRSLSHSTADGILGIDLAAPLAKGAKESVRIHYRSTPTSGLWFHGPTKEHPDVPLSVYSQGQGTSNRHWIPCYDEPDDRLTVEVHVTVNDPMKSASNGLLMSDTYSPGPKRTDYWKMERPIPTYLITLVVGMYDYWLDDGEPIVDFRTLGGRIEEAKHSLRNTRKMVELFEELTGVRYPYERYGQVFVWDFLFGGMENASMTTLNMRALHGPEVEPNYSADSLVAHELAHMWYGDMITCRTWHHIWLNEGFATYFADLWFEHAHGREDFRVRRFRQTRGYMDGTPKPEALGLTCDPRGDRPLELFGGKQYTRGAAILHQLRLELGDRTFFAAIRDYTEKHQDSAAVTEDFRRACERQAGRDLSWFFEQWVYGAGYPKAARESSA
jgi:aminopeptidase N